MLAKLRKDQENEEGFTLIELLVVVIIIGILAAIAIPVFLNQRTKAWDSAAKSDVKNMATAQETYLTDADEYTDKVTGDTDGLTGVGFSPSDGVERGTCGTGTGYTIVAKHENSTNYFYFDSDTGQLNDLDDFPTAGDTHCDVIAFE